MKSSKKRRARRTSKQRSAEHRAAEHRTAPPPAAFTAAEEAFFAAGVEASETGRFETLTEEAPAPRPGLWERFLLRRQRA